MAAPTTDVQICNLALDRIGQRPISSILTPQTPNEDVCARHYDTTRRELLRRYIFNFAKKYDNITKSPTVVPVFGYSLAFKLPNNFIRLLALGDVTLNADTPKEFYDISDGFIFTNQQDLTDTINILYVFDAVTVIKFDALFLRLLTLHLAANMAYKFSLKNSLIEAIRTDAADAALAAAAVSGQEKPPRRIERSRLRMVRLRGGRFRDRSKI